MKLTNIVLLLTFSVLCIKAQHVHASNTPVIQWHEHNPLSLASFRGSDANAQSLWVSGSKNTVLKSLNSGKSWQNVSVKSSTTFDFRDVEAFNGLEAIVMGAGSGKKSTLFKTVDGGKSWQLLYENKEPKGFFNSIDFWDKNTGLMLGDPVNGFYVVLKTLDGGKTWRRINKNKLPKMLPNEAAFAASGNTLITGEEGNAWIVTGGFSASVYKSEDFGESWERIAVPLYSQTQTSGAYALAINSKGDVFALGGDYKKRSDTYQNISSNMTGVFKRTKSGQKGLRTAMVCYKKTCLATGKKGTDISFDNGKNWTLLNSNDHQGYYTMASWHNVVVAAGEKGKVAVTHLQ